jgi:ketosteroid isomerase-like protein
MSNTMKGMGLALLSAAFAVFSIEALAADADVAAMQAADQTWLKSYNSSDAKTAASLYDENAILMPPGAPAAHGRAAIEKFLAADMAGSAQAGVTFHLGARPDGGANGDMGWVSGTYTVTDKAGKIVDAGKYLSVSKKEGGKWYYIRDTWNSDMAPPGAAPKK